ncbi:hypothetical protein D4764_04G0010510 [Takifugu flavidus]|uniref:Reverse transcriptase domain-containing protein n=1 Tax=Takifugu flavidus TaxID=433684 RepID=A0A5C6N4L3_9TELE|nr:hypothetical protein D4764_04G0010510 [Takifugu flavidus]
MKISTSKSKAMVLNRKKVECLLRVKEKILPQVEEFKYLGVLFTSEGRMEQEIDRRIGAASAVMQTLHQSVVVKRELSQKAKFSIYWSIFVPTLTYGHELWVMMERTRSQVQAAEMSFLRRVAGLSFIDRLRSSAIQEELGVEPLLLRVERSQMRWLGHLVRIPPGRLSGEVFRACPSVPKTPHLKELNSYRLVALTSHLMKTLDRLILAHLRPLASSFMDPLQFAYKPSIGVDDTIIYLLHTSLTHLEKAGSNVRIMFFLFLQCIPAQAAGRQAAGSWGGSPPHNMDSGLPHTKTTVCEGEGLRVRSASLQH